MKAHRLQMNVTQGQLVVDSFFCEVQTLNSPLAEFVLTVKRQCNSSFVYTVLSFIISQ